MNLRIILLAVVIIVGGIVMVSRVPNDPADRATGQKSVSTQIQVQTNKVRPPAAGPRPVNALPSTGVAGKVNIKSSAASTMPTIQDLAAALEPLTPEERAEYEKQAKEKVDSLLGLMTETDPQSIQKVVSEVLNPDVRIRDMAVNVIKQIHSADSISNLQAMVEKTDDPRMKVQLLDAIEFIKLPTLTEIREQKRLRAIEQGLPVKPKKVPTEPTLTAPVN